MIASLPSSPDHFRGLRQWLGTLSYRAPSLRRLTQIDGRTSRGDRARSATRRAERRHRLRSPLGRGRSGWPITKPLPESRPLPKLAGWMGVAGMPELVSGTPVQTSLSSTAPPPPGGERLADHTAAWKSPCRHRRLLVLDLDLSKAHTRIAVSPMASLFPVSEILVPCKTIPNSLRRERRQNSLKKQQRRHTRGLGFGSRSAKFPVSSQVIREAAGDRFAQDCLHRHNCICP